MAFAILNESEDIIAKSSLVEIERTAAKHVLSHVLDSYEEFTCKNHKSVGEKFAINTISNIFFNNKRKINTAAVRKDDVISFKKTRMTKRKICLDRSN